jgi:hypothetical protein
MNEIAIRALLYFSGSLGVIFQMIKLRVEFVSQHAAVPDLQAQVRHTPDQPTTQHNLRVQAMHHL